MQIQAQPSRASVAILTFADMAVGRNVAFDASITAADIDRFAELTGDFSPLHMDENFARARGFAGRVVHGAYLAGLVSRLIGMHLPGQDCLFQTVQMQFSSPTHAGDLIRITGVVDQISEAASAIVIKVRITRISDDRLLAKASVGIGFTKNRDPQTGEPS